MKRGFMWLWLGAMSFLPLAAQERVDTLLQRLYDGGKSDYVMIVAHRGDWRNAPENSLQAYRNCIDAGFDGIEVDVQMTRDSVVVVMHDRTLDRTTTGTGRVSDYTWAELQPLYLKSPIGVVTRQRIPSFDEVLELAKGKILIQVDKWQPIFEPVMSAIRRHGCARQMIFRSTMDSQALKRTYGSSLDGVILSPVLVCQGEGDAEKLDDFMNHLSTPMMSLSFQRDDYAILQRVAAIKERGFRIWYNALWSEFNGGHDDERSVNDPEGGYGWLLKHGANIIFSDHPFLLDAYLKSIGRR